MPVATPKRPKKAGQPAKKSLKGRITPEVAATLRELGAQGLGASVIARMASEKHRLNPPLSHPSVIAWQRKQAALVPPASSTSEEDLNLAPAELLKRQAIRLTAASAKLAEQGQGATYLRSLNTLATILKTADALAASERKATGGKTGLADLMTQAAARDGQLRQTDPEAWLAVAIPRVLPDLLEIAAALEHVPVGRRSEIGRPVVVALEAIGAVS